MAKELINVYEDFHMGLVADHGRHLVNQPSLKHFDKCEKITIEKISTFRKTNKQ